MKTPPPWGAAALVCIAGPTASGKSQAALALAERWNGVRPIEIVSVDSAQVYRGLDIGTAKPSAADRAAVPHHLIDVVDPSERWSAARFVAAAREAIAAIEARGALPLLVGGTMLYVDALFRGLDALPEADLAARAAIDARAATLGWPALHGELQAADPAAAARIAPNDAQRIQRALEVLALTGRPISSFHRAARPRSPMPPLIALEPTDRAWLAERIAGRFDAMLAAGFVDEVRTLRARGDLTPALPSMRAVGYRQIWDALDRGDGDTLRLRERAVAATRQLAKRQLTWLRSWPERIVVPCDAPDAVGRVADAATRALRTREQGE